MKKSATKKTATSKRATGKKPVAKKGAVKKAAKRSVAKKASVAVEAKFRPVCLTHPKKLGGFMSKAKAKDLRDAHEAAFPGHITDNEEKQSS